MRRKIIMTVLAGIFLTLIIGLYQYNKPHKDIKTAAVDFETSVDRIYSEFSNNKDEATAKYSEKVVLISGAIASINENQVGGYSLLIKGDTGTVSCELLPDGKSDSVSLEEHAELKIKGLFVGYDDLLNEIQFKKCIVTN